MYPPAWLDIGNFGAPDTEKYFSNENVGSVRELDTSGVLLAISVNPRVGQTCPYHERASTEITGQVDVNVDGVPAKLDAVDSHSDFELYIARTGYCYRWIYFFGSLATRDASESIAVTQLDNFRFGMPSAT
ncbi:MAG: hypothetical protein ACREOM_04215 [Candidatus Dormibacteraceae bacterium]